MSVTTLNKMQVLSKANKNVYRMHQNACRRCVIRTKKMMIKLFLAGSGYRVLEIDFQKIQIDSFHFGTHGSYVNGLKLKSTNEISILLTTENELSSNVDKIKFDEDVHLKMEGLDFQSDVKRPDFHLKIDKIRRDLKEIEGRLGTAVLYDARQRGSKPTSDEIDNLDQALTSIVAKEIEKILSKIAGFQVEETGKKEVIKAETQKMLDFIQERVTEMGANFNAVIQAQEQFDESIFDNLNKKKDRISSIFEEFKKKVDKIDGLKSDIELAENFQELGKIQQKLQELLPTGGSGHIFSKRNYMAAKNNRSAQNPCGQESRGARNVC